MAEDLRLGNMSEHDVTYPYTPSKTKQRVGRTVTGQELVRGFTTLIQALRKPDAKSNRYGVVDLFHATHSQKRNAK